MTAEATDMLLVVGLLPVALAQLTLWGVKEVWRASCA